MYRNENYPFYCAQKGDLRAIKRLVRRGFDVKTVDEGWGWTILGWACRYGRINVVRYLLSLNIDGLVDHRHINTGWNSGPLATPLHVAVEMFRYAYFSMHKYMSKKQIDNRYLKITKLLVENGANIHDMDRLGYTPFFRAFIAEFRNEKVVKYLEDLGCGGVIDLFAHNLDRAILQMFCGEEFFDTVKDIIDKFGDKTEISGYVFVKFKEQLGYIESRSEWDDWDKMYHDEIIKTIAYMRKHNRKILGRD